MKKRIILFALACMVVVVPFITSAAGLVPTCGNIDRIVVSGPKNQPILDANGVPLSPVTTPCDFNQLMIMINTIIHFLLFTIATPLVALIICYVGFLFLTSGGSAENRTKGKKILKNVIIGYIVALAAWLVINTIVKTLGFTGDTFLTKYN